MDIKKSLIDNLANSDWTREKLAKEVMLSRYLLKKEQAQSLWLDQLASLLREGGTGAEQELLDDEYRLELKRINLIYRA